MRLGRVFGRRDQSADDREGRGLILSGPSVAEPPVAAPAVPDAPSEAELAPEIVSAAPGVGSQDDALEAVTKRPVRPVQESEAPTDLQVEPPAVAAPPPDDPRAELADLPRSELFHRARGRGIPRTVMMTREELIEALLASDQVPPAG